MPAVSAWRTTTAEPPRGASCSRGCILQPCQRREGVQGTQVVRMARGRPPEPPERSRATRWDCSANAGDHAAGGVKPPTSASAAASWTRPSPLRRTGRTVLAPTRRPDFRRAGPAAAFARGCKAVRPVTDCFRLSQPAQADALIRAPLACRRSPSGSTATTTCRSRTLRRLAGGLRQPEHPPGVRRGAPPPRRLARRPTSRGPAIRRGGVESEKVAIERGRLDAVNGRGVPGSA